MRYRALATDYDGTLATRGAVEEAAIDALRRLLASRRKLLLITGRELDDLRRVFPPLNLFHRVVAENGALLYDPASATETLLCPPPSPAFIAQLRKQKIPLSVGRAIVATSEPHQHVVQAVIDRSGLDLQISFNKGSVMVLPTGVNKTTGLRRALRELGLSPDVVVGVGDAENDLEFLDACGFAVAVANALPSVKSRADLVTPGAHGTGLAEIIDQLLADDLFAWSAHRRRPRLTFPD